MIEAAMIWNEPNNKSHWDLEIDPDWSRYADMVVRAGSAIQDVNSSVTRVLGGMSPIDPHWVNRMRDHGALHLDGAQPVRGNLDHFVSAAGEPEVPIGVDVRRIA